MIAEPTLVGSKEIQYFWKLKSIKVSKGAKIRNRYNQVPHLAQDTNGKVTNSQLYATNVSQEISPFPAGDHKARINSRAQRHNRQKTEKEPAMYTMDHHDLIACILCRLLSRDFDSISVFGVVIGLCVVVGSVTLLVPKKYILKLCINFIKSLQKGKTSFYTGQFRIWRSSTKMTELWPFLSEILAELWFQ